MGNSKLSVMEILKQYRSELLGAIILSVVIHTLFCIQVFMALPDGMALGAGLLVFFPHYLFMFFLPPSYPIHDDGIVDYSECGASSQWHFLPRLHTESSSLLF